MTIRTTKSAFRKRLDTILQGITPDNLSETDREIFIEDALVEYNRDLPRIVIHEFAGDSGNYYLMFGNVLAVPSSSRDASIDIVSAAAADQKLGWLVTTAFDREVHGVRFYLRRLGETVEGDMRAVIYSVSASLPDVAIQESSWIDIDGGNGAPRGKFGFVEFTFDEPVELEAGDYSIVIEHQGYTYASGTTELNLGVDQSSVTNDLVTYNGTIWTAFGTASAVIGEFVAGVVGWRQEMGAILRIEYPAADITLDEYPQYLATDDYEIYRTKDGTWLRFKRHQPETTETVRMEFAHPYLWNESEDPSINVPDGHMEAICHLAAHYSCQALATRFGQKRQSSIQADSVEHRDMAMKYESRAKHYLSMYQRMLGLGRGGDDGKDIKPAAAYADIDTLGSTRQGYLFHDRRNR